MKVSFLIETEPSCCQEPVWTNSPPELYFHPRVWSSNVLLSKTEVLLLQEQQQHPSISLQRSLAYLSELCYWLTGFPHRSFIFCLFILSWFPNMIAQYYQQMERLWSSPEKWSMRFHSLLPWIHITPLYFIKVFLCFVFFLLMTLPPYLPWEYFFHLILIYGNSLWAITKPIFSL